MSRTLLFRHSLLLGQGYISLVGQSMVTFTKKRSIQPALINTAQTDLLLVVNRIRQTCYSHAERISNSKSRRSSTAPLHDGISAQHRPQAHCCLPAFAHTLACAYTYIHTRAHTHPPIHIHTKKSLSLLGSTVVSRHAGRKERERSVVAGGR